MLLQNPIDTSLNPLLERGEKYEEWVSKTIRQIKNITGKKVKVRLHPRFQSRFEKFDLSEADMISNNYDGWNKSNGGNSLYEDFEKALGMCNFF